MLREHSFREKLGVASNSCSFLDSELLLGEKYVDMTNETAKTFDMALEFVKLMMFDTVSFLPFCVQMMTRLTKSEIR